MVSQDELLKEMLKELTEDEIESVRKFFKDNSPDYRNEEIYLEELKKIEE